MPVGVWKLAYQLCRKDKEAEYLDACVTNQCSVPGDCVSSTSCLTWRHSKTLGKQKESQSLLERR